MVEVLLAMALGGLVLAAASALLVTLAQAWANRPATRDAFDAHVNGVAHFMSAVLEEATLAPLSKQGDQMVDTQSPVGFSRSDDELIYFYLREAPPLFVWPKGAATRVHVYLYFDEGEGLSFLWFSDLQELEKNDEGRLEPEDEDELKKTLISPFCSEVEYMYYGEHDAKPGDIKKWKPLDNLEELDSGDYRVPDFVKLIFRWEEEDLERTVHVAIKRFFPSGVEEEPL